MSSTRKPKLLHFNALKYRRFKLLIGLDTDFHNWDVPFPAVTICDLNPVDEELLQEYIERYVFYPFLTLDEL